ncbi:MAG: ATP-binding protein [Candidatus Woesearchaeota archaeon]
MYEIVIGRNQKDRDKYALKGTVPIAKHYVRMGQVSSLANPVYIDAVKSHVIFICGKRGSGKSYTMGSLAEGIGLLDLEVRQNIATLIFDTMGVFWTMKYPNKQDIKLVEEWNLEEKEFNVNILVPYGLYDGLKEQGLPVDAPFSIPISDLDGNSWCSVFDIDPMTPAGVFIQRVIDKAGSESSFEAIEREAMNTPAEEHIKMLCLNLFGTAKTWGIFSDKGTPMSDLIKAGEITVLDISSYASTSQSQSLRGLIIALFCQKIFEERMRARKIEEFESVKKSIKYYVGRTEEKKMPMVWLFVDEAHEFLPKHGQTLASGPLITLLREGRQPGISLVLASQQPGQIHTDVLTQSDIVISHRLTAKIDIDALGLLMQSYMREGLDKVVNNLPRVNGSAIIFDDSNERMYPCQIRPRYTWHGGSSPSAIRDDDKRLF